MTYDICDCPTKETLDTVPYTSTISINVFSVYPFSVVACERISVKTMLHRLYIVGILRVVTQKGLVKRRRFEIRFEK